jgi:cytochrome d ubiquinol oxidase subunit I
MDAELLSRLQFAFTIAFHIIFPSFTIGLASYLAVLEGLWLWRRNDIFLTLYRYWLKIFALSFGMGVVSGIVLSYQIGTNWGPFADQTGPVLGPLLGYEVLTAFFLEAGFLGVMLFGMNRVGKYLHFLATLLVAIGTLISTFWILSANSWMQTPAGFDIRDGQYIPADWWAVIFNPSFPFRLVHMVLAAYLTTAFVVGAVGAWHLLRDRRNESAALMLSMAMWMATLVAPLQIIAGDLHGLNTLAHQPAKVAALEGHWETKRGAPLILFAWPDHDEERNRYEVGIPKLGSFILTHDLGGEIRGLKSWPRDERPPSAIVFWSFRIMVGIGFAMALTGLLSLVLRIRGKMTTTPWFLRLAVVMGPTGFIAVLAGWVTTEVGRQPWLVYGLMRVSEGRSPIDAPAVAGSLLSFVVVYFIVFGAGIYYLLRVMGHPPDPGEPDIGPDEIYRASHPLKRLKEGVRQALGGS